MGHIGKGLKQKGNIWERDTHEEETHMEWVTHTERGHTRRRDTHGEGIYTERG